MTLLYGVGQTLFVALSSWYVGLSLLWSVVLLGVLLLIGLVWGGAEVIADRVPPEWTWLKAAFVTGPAAGLLSWILLTLFVDSVGIEDLSSALVGRASFTVLLVLLSVSVGSRLGWLSLRRSDDPRADQDPNADSDEGGEVYGGTTTASGEAGAAPVLPASTADRVAARRARRRAEQAAAASGTPETADPGTPTAAPSRPAPSRTRSRRPAARGDDPIRVPFGSGPFADPPSSPTPAATPSSETAGSSGYASPVVAVLPPVTPLPSTTDRAEDSGDGDEDEGSGGRRTGGSRRRFGLRRPDDEA
jgi:hypothetical protein